MIKIYQKQPVEAEKFAGSQKYIFGQKVIPDNSLVDAFTHDPVYYSIIINEDDSDDPEEEPDELVFEIGDWVIKDGEDIHSIADDVFKKKYAELPVIPKHVADWIESNRGKANLADMLVCAQFRIVRFDNYVEIEKWINADIDRFSRAWLDGYQVEEDE